MAAILIIGYGNPLRQDDAVGWAAGQRLSSLYDADRRVDVICCHQLTPELAEPLSFAQLALFLDAACQGAPGAVHESELAPCDHPSRDSTHHLTPQELLAMSVRLYERAPRACLLSVAGKQFELGEAMSLEAKRGLEQLVERARVMIEKHTTS